MLTRMYKKIRRMAWIAKLSEIEEGGVVCCVEVRDQFLLRGVGRVRRVWRGGLVGSCGGWRRVHWWIVRVGMLWPGGVKGRNRVICWRLPLEEMWVVGIRIRRGLWMDCRAGRRRGGRCHGRRCGGLLGP